MSVVDYYARKVKNEMKNPVIFIGVVLLGLLSIFISEIFCRLFKKHWWFKTDYWYWQETGEQYMCLWCGKTKKNKE